MKIGAQASMWKGNLDAALNDISTAGLEGIETFELLGRKYYDKPNEFGSLLKKHKVTLSGTYFWGDWITPETQQQELKKATTAIRFLKVANGEFLILHGGSERKEGGHPISAYYQLADTMNKIGQIGREYNIGVAVHPHVGTMVENREQLDLLMNRLDPELVGLCPHAPHFLYTGTDPYEIYESYAGRVKYVHVSDMRGINKIPDAYKRMQEEKKNRNEIFKEMKIGQTQLGQGELDQKALMKSLLKAGFNGWVVIEGSDPEYTPLKGIETAAAYLKKEFMKKAS